MTTMAILTDVTRCIGCEECVAACRKTNDTGSDAPYRWQGGVDDLSSTRWTTIVETENRFVRQHCRHCLDPACAAACPVGALKKTAEGPVAYDAEICMGCRYCMVACPFGMTRYEWDSITPQGAKVHPVLRQDHRGRARPTGLHRRLSDRGDDLRGAGGAARRGPIEDRGGARIGISIISGASTRWAALRC